MVLTYGKYIELLSVLDEHCNGVLKKNELQNAIFRHYIDKYGSFVAENSVSSKRLFYLNHQCGSKSFKREAGLFRNFMNQQSKKQIK